MKKFCLASVLFLLVFYSINSFAQCSVCKMGAETNIAHKENERGKGLNKGIIYLMSVPYLMGAVAGFIWWKNRKKATQAS